jgi:hypothetical protein
MTAEIPQLLGTDPAGVSSAIHGHDDGARVINYTAGRGWRFALADVRLSSLAGILPM